MKRLTDPAMLAMRPLGSRRRHLGLDVLQMIVSKQS